MQNQSTTWHDLMHFYMRSLLLYKLINIYIYIYILSYIKLYEAQQEIVIQNRKFQKLNFLLKKLDENQDVFKASIHHHNKRENTLNTYWNPSAWIPR